MRVTLSKSDRSFRVRADQTVLDAALEAGFNLPHSCKGGNCGACRARLLHGEIDYRNGRPLGLADSEVAEGLILLCQAHAVSDLMIETFEVGSADEVVIKRLPSRIERTECWAHDVLGVFLRLPVAERFDFQAGQYVDVMLPGGRRRSFSIASPPHDSRLLELHVRRVPGGEFTETLFAGRRNIAMPSALLTIEGPLGQFTYRPLTTGESRPMLLIGGGTGLAPLKSILRHVLEKGLEREMILYWGVRSERDLYAHAWLADTARNAAGFRYVPVLSEPSPGWQGRRGWVHEAALEDGLCGGSHDVYASGPPAMIAAVRRDFGVGEGPSRLFFDSFDYAPDSLARQRTMAASKS